MTEVTDHPIEGRIWLRTSNGAPEWVVEMTGVINDTAFVSRHTVPDSYAPEHATGLMPLYEAQDALLALADAVDATFVDADTHEAFKAFQRDHGRALKNSRIAVRGTEGAHDPSLFDKVTPHFGEHVGLYLGRVMAAAGVNAWDVAEKVGRSEGEVRALASHLDSLSTGHGELRAEVAVCLEMAFDLSAEAWMQMQAERDIDMIRSRDIQRRILKGEDYPDPIPMALLPAKIGNTPLASVLDMSQGMLDEMGLHDSQVMAGKLRELMEGLGMRPAASLFRPRVPA